MSDSAMQLINLNYCYYLAFTFPTGREMVTKKVQ